MTLFNPRAEITVYENDLPSNIADDYMRRSLVAVDTETRGLNVERDRLCLVQLCDSDANVSIIKIAAAVEEPANLRRLLEYEDTTKIFHYGRFDIKFIGHYLDIDTYPLFDTKIASKLFRTYTDRHSLKDLVKDMLGYEMAKEICNSDWATEYALREDQIEYAANDVLVLIPLYMRLKPLLEREELLEMAENAFTMLPNIVAMDYAGYPDLFSH